MSLSVNINPEDSPLARFAYELRTRRLEAGLTQRQFARRIGFSASQVAMVETLRRNPDELFAIACDKEFGLKDHSPSTTGTGGRPRRGPTRSTSGPRC
jgi:Predicted transcriptional regulators